MALKYKVDVIVFEHLSKFKGRSSEKVHYWRKKAIIKKVCHKAHYNGIRYATVNPRFTSMMAYDGSGFVSRGENANLKSFSLCKFKNGKVYNCDLSASYNIGARYFYREFKKEYPDILKKTSCNVTLSDIWGLGTMLQKAA